MSAHATHLVGSALSDPYLSFSAGMNGLAGPLHGLANQECLGFILDFKKKYGDAWTKADIAKHVDDTDSATIVNHSVSRLPSLSEPLWVRTSLRVGQRCIVAAHMTHAQVA